MIAPPPAFWRRPGHDEKGSPAADTQRYGGAIGDVHGTWGCRGGGGAVYSKVYTIPG
jgi:hypothetical protein